MKKFIFSSFCLVFWMLMRRSNRKHRFMKKINMLGAFILSCQMIFSTSGSNTDNSF